MSSAEEKDKIDRLRSLADRLAGDRWLVESDDGGTHLVAVRSTGDDAILATFHKDALRHEIELMTEGAALLFRFIDMFDRARRRVLDLEAQLGISSKQKRAKDYAAQASMLLDNRTFWRFLETRGAGGPVRDKTAADTRLKSVLAIGSKADINKDARGQSAWLSLNGDFENWKRNGG